MLPPSGCAAGEHSQGPGAGGQGGPWRAHLSSRGAETRAGADRSQPSLSYYRLICGHGQGLNLNGPCWGKLSKIRLPHSLGAWPICVRLTAFLRCPSQLPPRPSPESSETTSLHPWRQVSLGIIGAGPFGGLQRRSKGWALVSGRSPRRVDGHQQMAAVGGRGAVPTA